MKLCVIGTGYVGLVTGACMANLGNDVVCIDKDRERIADLLKGKIPFYEPGLQDMVSKNHKAGRLAFSADLARGVQKSDAIFIAVGTPPKKTGEADISSVVAVAESIAKVLKADGRASKKDAKFKIVVNKSTVPVGMGNIVTKIFVKEGVPEKRFAVISNPEFLREGSAIFDFMHPERIVIGASNNRAFNVITELYRSLNAHIIFTSVKSAELIKYASNAFLATKISFINEIANICEKVGSDVSEVSYAMGLDRRIGKDFLSAGIGYGGSCLPKDVSALIHLAGEHGYEARLLESVNALNACQADMFIEKIAARLKPLKGKQITVLGLSFKPDTDDLRDAPSLKIIKALSGMGAKIRVYDPSMKNKQIDGLLLHKDIYSSLKGSDAVVVATEWGEFRELDFEKVKKFMKRPAIFDGRNIYDPKRMRELGFEYFGIGK